MEDKIRAAFAEIQADDDLIEDTLAYLRREADRQRHRDKRLNLLMGFGAVAAMALLALGLFFHNLYFTTAAHISLDVNPSVELRLNRFDRVIDTYAFNKDGANILNEVSLRGKTYAQAAELLLSVIEADGYIGQDALIALTVQAATKEQEQRLCNTLSRFVNTQISTEPRSATVEVFPVSEEIWGNAHDCHLSPAKYLAIQELMEVDGSATIEDYADAPIRQIRQRTQACLSGHNTEINHSDSGPDDSEPYRQSEQEYGQGKGHGYTHGYTHGHGHGSKAVH